MPSAESPPEPPPEGPEKTLCCAGHKAPRGGQMNTIASIEEAGMIVKKNEAGFVFELKICYHGLIRVSIIQK